MKMDAKLTSVSVILPCLNEAGNVERTVRGALEALPMVASGFEILVVDDGSQDETSAIARTLGSEFPEIVRLVRHEMNCGYGAALRTGFSQARCDWVFVTDGDGQFNLQEMQSLLPLLRKYDAICGYRLNRRESWLRRWNGASWTWLVNRVFDMNFRDIDCAFKIFPRRFVTETPLRSTGALISAEMLASLKSFGYRIGQIGVHHYPRLAGNPTGASLGVILRAFQELLKLRREIRRRGKRLNIPLPSTYAIRSTETTP